MPPIKQCLGRGARVAIRKSVCECGHSFKTKPPVYSTRRSKRIKAFPTHKEVSAQEAVYRLLSLLTKQLSRSVFFVDTNPKSERIAVLKENLA